MECRGYHEKQIKPLHSLLTELDITDVSVMHRLLPSQRSFSAVLAILGVKYSIKGTSENK